jgi:fatty-acyl-CoA synthase
MRNVSDLLRLGAARWPTSDCVAFRGRRHTYQEFAEFVGGQAESLREQGIGPGDAVMTIGNNSDVLLGSYLALANVGALHVPLNTMTTVQEAADAAARTSAVAVIYGADYVGLVEKLRTRDSTVKTWIALESELAGDLSDARRAPMQAQAVGGDDPAMVIFTSGSTGRPKGCVKSHWNLLWHILNSQLGMPRTAADRELYAIPLAGIGLANFALVNFLSGAALVLERFDAGTILPTIASERITVGFLPPTMLHAILRVPGQDCIELITFRRLDTGYEMSARLRAQVAERFGDIVHYGYGSSEGTISYAPAECFMTDPQCVGSVFGLDELSVVNENGTPVAEGEVGEIIGRGPSVFREYLGDPELTAETLRDGWYHTGDLGWMGPGAMLHFAGRLKDMIKTGGMNVAAAEVEEALARHPAVDSVAVVGLHDERWGEAVVTAVVSVAGTDPTESELSEFARDQLANYKRPKHYVLLDELPVNSTGKIAKGQLREILQQKLTITTNSPS